VTPGPALTAGCRPCNDRAMVAPRAAASAANLQSSVSNRARGWRNCRSATVSPTTGAIR